MAEINDLNVADASNTARFPENQAPSTLNNGARALEGLLARWHKDTNASVASTGSANAYAVAANQTISSYYDGLEIAFDANFANTGAATLNVDTVGAASIKKNGDQDLDADDIKVGQKVVVIYDGTNWQMVSPLGNESLLNVGQSQTLTFADDGATSGPDLILDRNSTTAAAADQTGKITWRGRNVTPAAVDYAALNCTLLNTGVGTETGRLNFQVRVSGAAANKFQIADGIWTPNATGGDQGADSLNASAIYDDGNQIHALQDGLQTPTATTSGTAHDYTGIRSDARRITIMFEDVSLTGTDGLTVTLGDAGGFETSGYQGTLSQAGGTTFNHSTNFRLTSSTDAGAGHHGTVTLVLLNASTNTWAMTGTIARDDTTVVGVNISAGTKSLSAVLTQVRISRTGTDTFDAGNINVLIE